MQQIEKKSDPQMDYVQIGNENFYKISNSDAMRPFLMSIVSDSNHWMFISSNGALTAGRKGSDNALFPYYTDDKITESYETTGAKSIFLVEEDGRSKVWEPFSDSYTGVFSFSRNIYKNELGNKVIFEEINHDLELTFQSEWNSSNLYGFVKRSRLSNQSGSGCKVNILDGIQNIMPYGVVSEVQQTSSNLVDAYKKNELARESGLGIYMLSSIIVDRPEPSEALKANIVWSLGLEQPTYLLSSLQLDKFRKGKSISTETDIRAERGAYFVKAEIELDQDATKEWMIIANVNQGPSSVVSVSRSITTNKKLREEIIADIELGSKNLVALTSAADGKQLTADTRRNTRHYANVLFNIMRGGIFDDNYLIEKKDFIEYISKANKEVHANNETVLSGLELSIHQSTLKQLAWTSGDKNFSRLCFEYLPLKFSRRHGDPSRPWNKFSINTRSEIDGSKILDYQGNWRDIFQNWEALAHSYPDFIENMIHKFLNATTFDGYNPYRVTKDGFDWETIEPDDPWSYIGYWGDHQIIYLLKFLEFIRGHYPGALKRYFTEDVFVYANVPYKIKDYVSLLKNPKDTIDFDHGLDTEIRNRKEKLGADGALLYNTNEGIIHVNLVEKLLATLLAKCSNFIPEGGIWLNTQRPEWNDANNALVGNGVSMVTLYYIRRFMTFFKDVVVKDSPETIVVSEELATFFKSTLNTLEEHTFLLPSKASDADRKSMMDGLGMAGSSYRENIYANGFTGGKKSIEKKELVDFSETLTAFLDHSIAANKREDALYHAYNLMTLKSENEVSISHLSEMLEGQVAVLSSGYLSATESLELLDALKKSKLYREDQYSYLLYPNKVLLRFLEKNTIPVKTAESSRLLMELMKNGNTQLIEQDIEGNYHFNGNFNNVGSVVEALEGLDEEKYGNLIKEDKGRVQVIFEDVFNHKAFTGRSGTFYGYEGLGSIYWHMVSKLLLAVQECCLKAVEDNESDEIVTRLANHYHEINEGIGVHKSPAVYGAFPTDPYSHTPLGKGVQQPGMTGQVKEDILSRFGELGVVVKEGKLGFRPFLLRKKEFLKTPMAFEYLDVYSEVKRLPLEEGSLCFTYCQIPVIYKLSDKESLEVITQENDNITFDSSRLDSNLSKKVFEKSGEIKSIVLKIKEEKLL